MRNRVSLRYLGMVGKAVFWTCCVAGVFVALDRLAFGPAVREGWVRARNLRGLQASQLPSLPPPYLPKPLIWPPNQIFVRVKPETGWWVGVSDEKRTDIFLWIGAGAAPLPDPLMELKECVAGGPCPAGWSAATGTIKASSIYVVSKLGARETNRILVGLEMTTPAD